MLAREMRRSLQAASSIGVLKKAYLLIEPYWFTPMACHPEACCVLWAQFFSRYFESNLYLSNQPLGVQEQNLSVA